uniref:Olfactory receptor n=1 Tax=Leptobrachium leishanense TaxID=445787 RepID=A0A8C5QMX5_9ANUR
FREFQNIPAFNPLLFILILSLYVLTLNGNLMIITLVAKVPRLKSPMYFFLTQLSLSDILLTTNISPNMLHIILNGGSTISVAGCITQMYLHGVSVTAECLLLTVMSYDRYLAICKPLHYTSIMYFSLQLRLVITSWVLAFITCFICNLRFCGPHVINHYFCDLEPILELSCSDIVIVRIIQYILAILSAVLPFSFILSTYVFIFTAIFRIPSSVGKQKAFSTCSSHLIVVIMYYGTLITIYLIPTGGKMSNVNKAISLLYTTGTPLLNPVIYSLRSQDIRAAVNTFFGRR